MATTLLFSLLLIVVSIVLTYGANTTPSGERLEHNSIKFYYEPDFHYFVAVTSTTCFMAPLTHEERDHVHTSQGLDDLQLRMLREWIGQLAETKVYHDDPQLPPYILTWCKTRDMYILERNLGAEITVNSPLVG